MPFTEDRKGRLKVTQIVMESSSEHVILFKTKGNTDNSRFRVYCKYQEHVHYSESINSRYTVSVRETSKQ